MLMLAFGSYWLYSYIRTLAYQLPPREDTDSMQHIIELTLAKRTPSKVKVQYDLKDSVVFRLIGVCNLQIAQLLWDTGYPFTSIAGVSSANQLHALFIAEYDRVTLDTNLRGSKTLSSSLDVSMIPSGDHLSPGWIHIRLRGSKEYIYHGHVLNESLV